MPQTRKANSALQFTLAPEKIAPLVVLLRGEKVLLDVDLSSLYGVSTGRLNEAVKRNKERFPNDFMFQLTEKEWDNLKSQFAISRAHGGRRSPPFAFTEQGVAMLSSVLRSPGAVSVNIAIMRTFVQLRRLMESNRDLAQKIEALEKRYDAQFHAVFQAIKSLIAEGQVRRSKRKRQIGFHSSD